MKYSGSGVLFVLKRVFVSFSVSFSLRFVFLPFLRMFLTKNAFYVSPIPWLSKKRFVFNQSKTAAKETFETGNRLTNQ